MGHYQRYFTEQGSRGITNKYVLNDRTLSNTDKIAI